MVRPCLLVGMISDYRTPDLYPKNPRWAWGMHPCLLVEYFRLSNMISIALIYLLDLTKDFTKTTSPW
jgi:hypothetical protein